VVSVIIREVHRADVPGNPHYIASVQLVDEEDGWVSPAFPVDYRSTDELKRKILHEVQLYLDAKATIRQGRREGRDMSGPPILSPSDVGEIIVYIQGNAKAALRTGQGRP